MPCDTIQLNSINVPKMNPALRAKGLRAMGITIGTVHQTTFTYQGHTYTLSAGALVSRTASDADLARVAALVKQHYSAQVVQYTAARNGWQLKQTGQFAYEVIKP